MIINQIIEFIYTLPTLLQIICIVYIIIGCLIGVVDFCALLFNYVEGKKYLAYKRKDIIALILFPTSFITLIIWLVSIIVVFIIFKLSTTLLMKIKPIKVWLNKEYILRIK